MPKEARSPSVASQESNYSAVIIADMVAEVQQPKKEGTNISKGVILNALQQNESKLSPVVITQKKEDFNDMSPLRKIAFAFSFLPSVMFVLCFAVIFPCEKILPCAHPQWNIHLNNTEITSNLLVSKNILFTFSNQERSGLRSLSATSGEISWENNLTSNFLKCGKFALSLSCLIVENNGTIHLFDPSNGRTIWDLNLNIDIISLTVLPDCNNDGLDEIAVITTNSQIRIISLRSIFVKDCDSIPSDLVAWKRHNETDLIFICKYGGNERLLKVSQEEWCKTDKNQEVKISTLTIQKSGILSQSQLLPINEGLILWTKDSVRMFKKDGQQRWSVSSSNHSSKNRFLMNGKFQMNKKEVILYSSDISTNLQVTRLNTENGQIIKSKTFPNIELTEAVMINGEDHDFILGLKRKKMSESLKAQINHVSASVINILTPYSLNTTSRIMEEITLMEMDGSDLQTIEPTNELRTSSFTVTVKKNDVKLYAIRKNNSETIIQSITISNWDTSSEKTSYCVWK